MCLPLIFIIKCFLYCLGQLKAYSFMVSPTNTQIIELKLVSRHQGVNCHIVLCMMSWPSFKTLARGCSVPFSEQPIKSTSPNNSSIQLLNPGLISTYLNHPLARYQATRDSLYTSEPLKLLKLAHLKPGCPDSPVLSLGNHNKGSYQQCSSPLCLAIDTGDSLWPPGYVMCSPSVEI